MKKESTLLFNNYDLAAVLNGQEADVNKRLEQVPAQQLLTQELEHLVATLAAELKIEPIILKDDDITVEQSEAKVDVRRDFMRAIPDRSRPFYIDGIRVTYYVPFSGDPELFKCRPNSYTHNPPHAQISGNELLFQYDVTDGNVASSRPAFDRELANVRQWATWSASQVGQYNEQLTGSILQKLAARKQRLEESQKNVTDLGFKVRQKAMSEEPAKVEAKNKPKPRSKSRKATPNGAQEYDVALSYAGEDRGYVERVATLLREAGVRVFYDKFEEADLWGRNLADHLGDVYEKRSKFIVIFASKHYAAKQWTNHERKHAQARAIAEQRVVILPAKFDDTEVTGLPNTVGYLDLRKIGPESLVERILQKLELSSG